MKMMRLFKLLSRWVMATLISSVTVFAPSVQANDVLVSGDMAPDFSLPNQAGETVTLSDFRGQWVVLYFYPKNDTPGCTTEACSFRDNINRLIAQQAVVLGVSLDSQASHEAFARKHQLPFDLLADETGEVAKQYNALSDWVVMRFAKRQSFIIDPQGRLAKVYRDVNPDEHVKEVIRDLSALQAEGK